MCTLTLVRSPSDPRCFRAIFTRDELRSRAPEMPPRVHVAGTRTCLWPLDPDRGGTWLGVNDAGVLACVLNRNEPSTAPASSLHTRGVLPQLLLSCSAASQAPQLLAQLDGTTFGPCTLVCADAVTTLIFRNTRRRFVLTTHQEPSLMLTSSGLGDALVQGPRQALWNQLQQDHSGPRAAQLPFHAHRWSHAPHLSVLMERPDARSTSITTASLTRRGWYVTTTPIPRVSEGHSTTRPRAIMSRHLLRLQPLP